MISRRGFFNLFNKEPEYKFKDPNNTMPSTISIVVGGFFFTGILLFGSGMVTPSDFQQWEPIGRDK